MGTGWSRSRLGHRHAQEDKLNRSRPMNELLTPVRISPLHGGGQRTKRPVLLRTGTRHRCRGGGFSASRARFAIEVATEIATEVGADRTADSTIP